MPERTIAEKFSHIVDSAIPHLAAFSYTSDNAGLYFATAHLFFKNIDLLDHSTTQPESAAEWIFFAVIAVCSLNLIISGHKSMLRTFEQTYRRFISRDNNVAKIKVILDVASGLYKAGVSLSSLFVLIYKFSLQYFEKDIARIIAGTVTAIFFPGCAIANTSILLAPFASSLGCINSPTTALWLARAFSFFYTSPSSVMYFYNLLMAPMRLGWLEKPLHEFAVNLNRPGLCAGFWISAGFSLHFCGETFRSFSDKINSILYDKHSPPSSQSHQIQHSSPVTLNPFSWRERLHISGVIAGTFKNLITTLGFMVAMKLTGEEFHTELIETIGHPIAGILFVLSLQIYWAIFSPSEATLHNRRERRARAAAEQEGAVPLMDEYRKAPSLSLRTAQR